MSGLIDLLDSVDRKAAQLEALLNATDADVLGELSSDLRSNYLWLCRELVTQIKCDFEVYQGLLRADKERGAL